MKVSLYVRIWPIFEIELENQEIFYETLLSMTNEQLKQECILRSLSSSKIIHKFVID